MCKVDYKAEYTDCFLILGGFFDRQLWEQVFNLFTRESLIAHYPDICRSLRRCVCDSMRSDGLKVIQCIINKHTTFSPGAPLKVDESAMFELVSMLMNNDLFCSVIKRRQVRQARLFKHAGQDYIPVPEYTFVEQIKRLTGQEHSALATLVAIHSGAQ